MKKVLSPLLSALLLAGCAAGADVPTVQPTAAPETPDTAQSSETAETAGAAAAPQGLIPTDAPMLDYDDIRLIAYAREFQTYPDTDYYTMCRDGKWGLLRSDGTEVLPCRAPYPLFECGWNAHHWHGYTDGMTWEEIEPLQEQLNAQLKETGDGVLCDAHDGGGYRMFVYLQDASVYVYAGSIGPGEFAAPTERGTARYNANPNLALHYDDNDNWPPRSPVAMWFDDTILDDFLKDWAAVQKKLYAGEITKAEYFEWKVMWPSVL